MYMLKGKKLCCACPVHVASVQASSWDRDWSKTDDCWFIRVWNTFVPLKQGFTVLELPFRSFTCWRGAGEGVNDGSAELVLFVLGMHLGW